MNNLDLDHVPYILIKVLHSEVDIMQVVEVPALLDHRVAQDIAQVDRIDILMRSKVLNASELDWS